MQLDWNDIRARAQRGEGISWEEARAVVDLADLDALFDVASSVRSTWKGQYVNTCGISNAKSGRCPEACSFCSQSAHFSTDAPKYTMKDAATLTREAKEAWENGVREFSLVASGRAMTSPTELATLKDAVAAIREETGMQTCASLGLMSKEALAELQAAGLQSVHHNLETARSHHANIVQTHSYDDEVETVKAAKSLGMYTCCGGIFGMGESWEQRIELAMELRDLDVDSVPVNFLNPRPGTPLEDQHQLTAEDCLKIIALYRLVLPTKDLIVCGGRGVNLGERQQEIFRAGANGVMLGNYLTTAGRDADLDLEMIEREGLVIRPPPHKPHPPSLRPGVRAEGTDSNGVRS
ncbi:MAG: biotin synthase BioB [Myxococcota bacterium]